MNPSNPPASRSCCGCCTPKSAKALAPATSVIDPVCGMAVDPSTARASAEYGGVTYHFCNPRCLANFENEPRSYAP